MELENMLTLIRAVSESSLKSFELEDGSFKISIKKGKTINQVFHGADGQKEVNSLDLSRMELPVMPVNPSGSTNTPMNGFEHIVKSPLVGTFYSSPAPESESFVKAGDLVKKGQVLGIIEAMKLMNEIECEYDGVLEAVLIEDEQVVEFGQPLFRIK